MIQGVSVTKGSFLLEEVEKNIFIVDNFYSEIDILEKYIRSHYKNYMYHEGDRAYMFMSGSSEQERALVGSYCSLVADQVEYCFGSKVKRQNHISAILYPIGGMKGVHVDNFHKDKDGIDHDIHVYTATHFACEPESGGELFFPDFNLNIASKRNRIVLFDARYRHGSSEVLMGEKISINYFWEIDEV